MKLSALRLVVFNYTKHFKSTMSSRKSLMSTSPKIDAHQHFWQISRGDYDWMTDCVADIRHDTLPADLSPLLAKHEIAGNTNLD